MINMMKDIIRTITELNIPKPILFPIAMVLIVYALWKIADITQRMSHRAATSERNRRYEYKSALWCLETGRFDKFRTKEDCLRVVELYKDGIPKDNKLKRFAANLFDWIKLLPVIAILFLMYSIIKF